MRKKKILTAALAVMLVMPLTGCANDLIDYITREDPYDVIEEYVEEKYGIKVEVIDTNFDTGYMETFWHASGYSIKVTCDELPGQEIGVAAGITDDNEYCFYDEYQREYHLKELQQMVTELVQIYADEQDVYIHVYPLGDYDKADVEMMSISEYTTQYERYGICLLARKEKSEAVTNLAEKIQDDLQEQKIICEWCVGVVSNKEDNIENYVTSNGGFHPWGNGKVQWLLEMPYDGDWEVQTE